MKAILTQYNSIEVLKGEASVLAHLIQEDKTKMVEKAMSTIILWLSGEVIRDVSREKTKALMW